MPPRLNMAAYCLARARRDRPNHPALMMYSNVTDEAPNEVWTFAELEDAVLRAAGALQDLGAQHSIPQGARVLIRLENTSAYAILYFAVIAAGFVAVAASSQLTAPEADFLLRDSGTSIVALADGLPRGDIPAGIYVLSEADVRALLKHPRRADYADTRPDDPAYLIYTSGTTASPKGVVHAHRVGLGRSPTYQGWYGITPGDRMLHAGAFNWTYTLGVGLTDPWANGATSLVFVGDKDPALWPRLIAQSGATIFAGVPTLYRQILKYANPSRASLGALRHGLIAGEKPPAGLLDAWFAATGTRLYEAYGMSELSTFVSSSPSVPSRPDFIGRPQAGRAVAIVPVEGGTEPLPPGQEGLIAAHRSDPGLMLGYWRRPAEEAEMFRADWFIGGDLGMMDADGYISHRGRANDLMKALGYRVSPAEVEATLAEHPDVAEVACAEVAVRADVSVIGAFIVPRAGAVIDADAIRAFAAERLAAYKCPREIVVVDALPRTPNGKLKRALLKATVSRTG